MQPSRDIEPDTCIDEKHKTSFVILAAGHSSYLTQKQIKNTSLKVTTVNNHGTPSLNVPAEEHNKIMTKTTKSKFEDQRFQESSFYDERLIVKPLERGNRSLSFQDYEPDNYQQMAVKMHNHNRKQLHKLCSEISEIAPKTESQNEEIPNYEWWDSVILEKDLDTYVNGKIAAQYHMITNLIEHSIQAHPPNESTRPASLPKYLTKKEQKKLRRQNRREAWMEEQKKIRLGLIEPPESKLKISNLMRVLENEAIQDPTKIEAHVREQMAKRQKEHNDAKEARKLTVEQRREKKIKKLKEDTSMGVHVSVYRIRDLRNVHAKKFKVETNAKQLYLSGVVSLLNDFGVVVVEGGPKQQRKYRRLMMHRIKWDEDLVKCHDGTTTNGGKQISNSCTLAWEGKVQKRNFGTVGTKKFSSEQDARDFFRSHHCENYWDLAYSKTSMKITLDLNQILPYTKWKSAS